MKLKNLSNNYFEFDSPSNLTKQLLSLLDNQRIEFIAFAITFDHLYSIESFLEEKFKENSNGIIVVVDHDQAGTMLTSSDFQYSSNKYNLKVFFFKE